MVMKMRTFNALVLALVAEWVLVAAQTTGSASITADATTPLSSSSTTLTHGVPVAFTPVTGSSQPTLDVPLTTAATSITTDATTPSSSSSNTDVGGGPVAFTPVSGSSQPLLDVPSTTEPASTDIGSLPSSISQTGPSQTSLDTPISVHTTGTPRIFAPKTGSRQAQLDVPTAPVSVASSSQTSVAQPEHVAAANTEHAVVTTSQPDAAPGSSRVQSPGQAQNASPGQLEPSSGVDSPGSSSGDTANPAGIIASLLGDSSVSSSGNQEAYSAATASAGEQQTGAGSSPLQTISAAGRATGAVFYGVDGTTVSVGAPATVIDGTTYSLAPFGVSLWIDGVPASVPPGSVSTKGTSGRETGGQGTSDSESSHGSVALHRLAPTARGTAISSARMSAGSTKSTEHKISTSTSAGSISATTGSPTGTARPTRSSSGASALLPNLIFICLCLLAASS